MKKCIIILYLLLLAGDAFAGTAIKCIRQEDFGLGGTYYIQANPDYKNTSATSNLIREEPKKDQIAPWLNTGLFTTGITKGNTGNALIGVVSGEWFPWGMDIQKCSMVPCDPNDSSRGLCMPGEGVVVDNSSLNKIPCTITDGYGLYGLIAIQQPNGSYPDPNKLGNAITLSPYLFRTFHVAPLKDGRGDDQYFSIDSTQTCEVDASLQQTICTQDRISDANNPYNGQKYIKHGKLYFKILDRYYEDNEGRYEIAITSGVYRDKGFIQKTVEAFEEVIDSVTQSIYQKLTNKYNPESISFINIVRAILILYIAVFAIMFMTGLTKMHHSNLIVHGLKFGIIVTLISNNSWDFFNNTLFKLFREGSREIAAMMIDITMIVGDIPYILPKDATAFSTYDILLKMMISEPIHAKIWSLLFFDWHFYFIPCIYFCLVVILLALLYSLKVYLFATLQIALLIMLAPIFLIMMLFSITKSMFDSWIKALISSSFSIILVFATVGLMLMLVVDQIENLLNFRVCWQKVWHLHIASITIWDLFFWYPDSAPETLRALSLMNFLALLFISLVFFSFIGQVTSLADSLSNISRPLSSGLEQSASQQSGFLIRMSHAKTVMHHLNSWDRTKLIRKLDKKVSRDGKGTPISSLLKADLANRAIKGVRQGHQAMKQHDSKFSDIHHMHKK